VLPQLLDSIYASGLVEDATGERLPAFPESVPRHHAEELARLVRDEGARSTLETGMAYGTSTVAIASGASRHVAIDPHQHASWRGIGLLNAERAGVADRVRLIEERSEVALPALLSEGLELDLALLDGMHLFDHTLLDFFYCDRMLRVGGVVVFHDTWIPGVRQAAEYVLANRAYERTRAGDDDMWVLRKAGEDDRAWDFHRDFVPQRRSAMTRPRRSMRRARRTPPR
jgi:predicted O-methyltransferase YrrM